MWLALLLSTGLQTPAAETLHVGDRVEAVLGADAERSRTPALEEAAGGDVPAAAWPLAVDDSGWVTIDLVSHVFDAYLVLRDGNGEVLAEADGGGLARHAHLELVLQVGTYRLEACSLDRETGPFALTVRPDRTEELDEAARRELELADARAAADALTALRPGTPRERSALERLVELARAAGETALQRAPLARLYVLREEKGDALGAARIAYALAEVCLATGAGSDAQRHAERAVALFESELGTEDLEVAEARALSGAIAFGAGRGEEAVLDLERAFRTFTDVEGVAAPRTLLALRELWTALVAQGRVADARRLDEAHLAPLEAELGPGAPETLELLARLGDAAHRLADLAAARAYLERLVAASGDDPERLARALEDLAWVFLEQDRPREAARHLERALSLREGTQEGDPEPRLACALDLGRARLDAGLEARPLLEQALEGYAALLGEAHPTTAAVRLELARAEEGAGDAPAVGAARDQAARARAALDGTLGPDHPWTLAAAFDVARLEAEHGDPERAAALLGNLAAGFARALGEDHPEVGRVWVALGALHARTGRLANARTELERGRAVLLSALGPHAPEGIAATTELARVEVESGLVSTARDLLLEDLASRPPRAWDAWSHATERRRFEALAAEREELELLLSLAEPGERTGVDLEAFEAFSRWRAWRADARFTDREHLERRAGEAAPLLRELARLRTELARLAAPGDGAIPGRAERAAALGERVRELESGLARRLGAPRTRLPYEQLVWGLEKDGALVELAALRPYRPGTGFGEPRLQAWVMRKGPARIERIDLGPAAELARLAADLADALAAGRAAETEAGAAAERLWWPIAARLGDERRVHLVLDPLVVGLPFEALPARPVDRAGGERPKLVLEERTLVHVAALAGRLGEPADGGASRGSLLVAGGGARSPHAPEDVRAIEAADVPEANTSIAPPFPDGRRVPGAEAELERVLRLHAELTGRDGVRLDRRGELAASTLARELTGRDTVHSALPSVASDDPSLYAPLPESGAPAEGAWLPGRLTAVRTADDARGDDLLDARALGLLDLSGASLVTLTGTAVRAGDAAEGEALLGLVRGLETAGARAVVATRWRGDPEDLSDLCLDLYREVWGPSGHGPAEALRRAQLAALRRALEEDGTPHPERWAGVFAVRSGR